MSDKIPPYRIRFDERLRQNQLLAVVEAAYRVRFLRGDIDESKALSILDRCLYALYQIPDAGKMVEEEKQQLKPLYKCPECEGDGYHQKTPSPCRNCKGKGWVTE